MKARIYLSVLIPLVLLLSCTLAFSGETQPFPPAKPESQGLDPAKLEQLARIVQGFFDDGDIAGAELLAIKNRRTVLHEAIGWKDATDKVPMERNTIFNIRSGKHHRIYGSDR